MKACFPVAHDRGLESRVYPHLGSAPWFLLVDTETRATLAIANPERGSAHGRCHPLDVIADEKLDLLVVSGIGGGALDRLRAAGVRVYHTARATVGEALDAIARGALPPVVPGDALAGGFGRRRGPGHAHHGRRGAGHGPHHGCRGGCGA
ncbi:MAG TPA: NifB/NifX family molybdenum-iron cluster-binding protein [Anaeromyxobacter sp.]